MMKIGKMVSVKDVKTGKIKQIALADIDSLDVMMDHETHQRAFFIASRYYNDRHYQNGEHILPSITISTDAYEQLYDYAEKHDLIKEELDCVDIDVDRMVMLKKTKDLHPVAHMLFKFGLIRKVNQ